jgi:hypothetical protein
MRRAEFPLKPKDSMPARRASTSTPGGKRRAVQLVKPDEGLRTPAAGEPPIGRTGREARRCSAEGTDSVDGDRRIHDARARLVAADRVTVLLGHYARMLWDVQRARVSMGLRRGAMERDGLNGEWFEPLSIAEGEMARIEKGIDRYLAKLGKTHALARFVVEAPGVGLGGFARLIACTGDLSRFANPAKLWAYLGMDVRSGRAPRRKRGEKSNWSQQGRVVCHQLGEAIVKVGRGRYREAYDRKRAEYVAREPRGPSACVFGHDHRDAAGKIRPCGPAHIHAAAQRYAVKVFLADLWGASACAPRLIAEASPSNEGGNP